ncbi:methylated-DNA--[protein]-cysteine S-methyltransferase [Aquabacterium sp.]|uniref:methylated-DNA--[protein]-cysteine S-methyltransferase n=1 Tax=Aquabacterium sp. TaxID=1872578 RepID=UPI002C491CB0|nr:methylated-DNA--[protein]-cysteine S-methyltransferase [Aquabacterium sp.]HSW06415.1 methylated-DNA--[protein]-cysteine S-methyltransferase [Aquabacterium sp.]
MQTLGWTLFDTAIGACAVAWGEGGITGAQLPQVHATGTRSRMRHRFPGVAEGSPPPEVAALIDAVQALLRGEPRDLSATRLDFDGVPAFHRRVYELALTIPPGRVLSYGEIAQRLGDPGAARAVGQALGANPFAPIVPCHRVLAAGGRAGGFSAHGGAETKLKMLAIEGARPDDQPSLF